MGIQNGSFEYAGATGGTAAGWTFGAVTQDELWASFDGYLDDGSPVVLGVEDWRDFVVDWHYSFDGSDPAPSIEGDPENFESGWQNVPYFLELPVAVEAGTFAPWGTPYEGFDSGWQNDTYYLDWSVVPSGVAWFANPGSQSFEGFEGAWKSNQSFWWEFGDTSWTFAAFDSIPEAVEDFEEDWPTEIAGTF